MDLATPAAVQAFLDQVPYSAEEIYRSPRRVLSDRLAHCFDGALFAAAALRRLGHKPRVVELLPEPGRDDSHLLAVFRVDGHWGAVAQSNFTGLRYREPVYRTLRELAMSYFEVFYNLQREKTLRGCTWPLDLSTCDRWNWMGGDEHLEAVARRLDQMRRFDLVTPQQVARLSPLDERSFSAGLAGSDPAGIFQPPPDRRG